MSEYTRSDRRVARRHDILHVRPISRRDRIVRDYVVLWHRTGTDQRVARCHDILRLHVRTRGMR
jgi:hypothetical protein